MIKAMFNVVGKENANLVDLRKFVITLLSFVGFMRFEEVSGLRKGDVTFRDRHTVKPV